MKHNLSFLITAFWVLMGSSSAYADDNQDGSDPYLPNDSVEVTPKIRTVSYIYSGEVPDNQSWTPRYEYEDIRYIPMDEICDEEWHSNYYVVQCDVKVGTIVSNGLTLEPCNGTDLNWITTCSICDISQVLLEPTGWNGEYESLEEAEKIVRENSINGTVYGGLDSLGRLNTDVWYHEEFPMPDADVTILNSVWYGVPTGVSLFAMDNVGKIHTGPSSLFVESEGIPYAVYTVDGVQVYRGSDGVLSLNSGVYVVKVGNGRPVKVVVP
ncbi:MAG: hypothetical protein J6T28_04415 [Paludibacteraceae bacterium]|nr:hypothetical protein [Paludibacteraceae bacterium]MBP5481030.1 hypothetical protein [Paludibacteraceae bacterium]